MSALLLGPGSALLLGPASALLIGPPVVDPDPEPATQPDRIGGFGPNVRWYAPAASPLRRVDEQAAATDAFNDLAVRLLS